MSCVTTVLCEHRMLTTLLRQLLSVEYYLKQLQLLFTDIVVYLLLILICYAFVQYLPDLLLLLSMQFYCIFPWIHLFLVIIDHLIDQLLQLLVLSRVSVSSTTSGQWKGHWPSMMLDCPCKVESWRLRCKSHTFWWTVLWLTSRLV